jgi:type III secretory pathway component EscT
MTMSPGVSIGTRLSIVCWVMTPAGSISQISRGTGSEATASARSSCRTIG